MIDDKIICMHGGLSPELENLDQIRGLERPTDVPDQGLLCDLLWADPDGEIKGWGENDRGVSYTFGADKVAEFLKKHDLDLICRAHQVIFDFPMHQDSFCSINLYSDETSFFSFHFSLSECLANYRLRLVRACHIRETHSGSSIP